MHVASLNFRPALKLGPVDGMDEDGPVVRFDVLDNELLRKSRGVYIVATPTDVLYCGKYTGTLSKRWLYARLGYVYHFKRGDIAAALADNTPLTVYAETEELLRSQLNNAGEWVDINSIEANLIRRLNPIWNRMSG